MRFNLATAISLITLLSMLFGTYFWIEARYAKADDLKETNQRLDYKIKSDQADSIQGRLWKLEDRYQDPKKMPPTVYEEYRVLKEQKKSIDGTLKVMEKK
jgi:hypothetical protein